MNDLVRYRREGSTQWGVLDAGDGSVRALEGDPYAEWSAGSRVGSIEELSLTPCCQPRTVAALAYNYKDLVGPRDTYDEPLVFLKAPACLVAPHEPIRLPAWCERVWVEVELALVIGRPVFEASSEEAARAILGWTIANDVTASNICGRDHHLARSKSHVSFCPVGDILRRGIDTAALRMTTTINGCRTQDGCTRDRILGDAEAVALVSRIMPLFPGDIVLTGTPAGAMSSLITPGDRAELEIESIGRLANPIIRRGSR